MTTGEGFTLSQLQHEKSDGVQLAPATHNSKTVEAPPTSIDLARQAARTPDNSASTLTARSPSVQSIVRHEILSLKASTHQSEKSAGKRSWLGRSYCR